MSSTDAAGADRKAAEHRKKVAWPPQYAECPERVACRSPVAETMLSRPRSATPTTRDKVLRERFQVPEEAKGRHGGVGGGGRRPFTRHQPAGTVTIRPQEERSLQQRIPASDHHRRIAQAVIAYNSCHTLRAS